MTKEIELVQVVEPFAVYVPMLKASLQIRSEDVEQLGQFSRFVLWAIGTGGSIDLIEEVTALSRRVIIEEVDYLQKIGLLALDDQECLILTELGDRYYRLLSAVDEFNNISHLVQINGVTGLLEPDAGANIHPTQLVSSIPKLQERIIRELYQNEDPSNAREFLQEHPTLQTLTAEEKENLHVEVHYDSQVYYKQMRIESVPALNAETAFYTLHVEQNRLTHAVEERLEDWISIETCLYPITLQVGYRELEPYRHALSTIRQLSLFDPELISSKAHRMLDLYQQESRWQQECSLMYFDPMSGRFFPQIPLLEKTETSRFFHDKLIIPPVIRPDSLQASDLYKAVTARVNELKGEDVEIQFEIGNPIRMNQEVPAHLILK